MLTIGVLSLQGAVAEHFLQIERLGARAIEIKQPEQLTDIDGLIIPGGESTTMRKLMDRYGFIGPLKKFANENKPIFGTCAGMVLLAKKLSGSEEAHLGLIDITVTRNAFGRQRDSFETTLNMHGLVQTIPAVFIRAPIIEEAGEEVEVLASHEQSIVAARQGNVLVCSFHPELTEDTQILGIFIEMIKDAQKIA
ncbi:pyridoxal 5'-phosphate synthase glutaminase subunit PdxT [Cytobacillus purgationiresistens]|uniref:Pyridoxal 5'-phosphate synthase subunit PdxT n=1 Tax=Cytobacillus purgationiresistens TaxID=863449 RepID=A0ABU0ADM1_9BACI|nr:pyridoxal 5'-phosphate synthase glutaminase subunit PdxT [Cytobacillus purgationiresistens]MDQ0269348.1 5'-phosphate synthase pdxT subunit [Cytobacillus purgationiresistens]